jgi:nitrite reductase/ring-hydroxylating ferredoxin subunit
MEIEVALTKNLPPGKMAGVLKNGKGILVANVNGEYFAIGNVCTHMGCKLSEGTLSGEKVECPCHGSAFNIRTGAIMNGPAGKPEPSYKVKIDGDKILVTL